MKKIIFTALILSIFSCSNDDETTDNDNLTSTTFINLNSNNYWKYRIETKVGTNPTTVSTVDDHLKVGEEVTEGGNTYRIMEAEGTPTGFYTGVMDDKKLRKVSDELQFTGTISLDLGNGIPTQSIPVENFKIFKESATNGQNLDSKEGSLAPITLPVNGTNYNIYVNYKLKSIGGETLNTFTPPTPNSGIAAETYTNVKSVKFVLNLKMYYNLVLIPGFPAVTFQLLNPTEQDVIVSNNYYAKNKGVVYTQTNTNFTFANAPNTTTPLLPAITNLQREYITTFVNN